MTDLSKSTDTDLEKLKEDIAAEQKRRAEVSMLRQDAKVASEQIVTATKTLESYGAGNRFELLRALLPEDFIDWVAFGGSQKAAWKQPTDTQSMYGVGDLVVYQGQTYKSLVSQNSFSPSEAPSLWQLI